MCSSAVHFGMDYRCIRLLGTCLASYRLTRLLRNLVKHTMYTCGAQLSGKAIDMKPCCAMSGKRLRNARCEIRGHL
eukprot:1254090-Lingulodinium_polyedra.AAC.1